MQVSKKDYLKYTIFTNWPYILSGLEFHGEYFVSGKKLG